MERDARPAGAQVLPLTRLRAQLPPEPPGTSGPPAPAAPLAGVLDAYARQSDQIATLVEDWRATLPDTARTRRYAAAVLAALGELHVALDTAAHLVALRIPPGAGVAASTGTLPSDPATTDLTPDTTPDPVMAR